MLTEIVDISYQIREHVRFCLAYSQGQSVQAIKDALHHEYPGATIVHDAEIPQQLTVMLTTTLYLAADQQFFDKLLQQDLITHWSFLEQEPFPIPFQVIVDALITTRNDGLDDPIEEMTTLIVQGSEGYWSFSCGNRAIAEEQGHPDTYGNRAWSLPMVNRETTDQQIEVFARSWADGTYKETYRFPPITVLF